MSRTVLKRPPDLFHFIGIEHEQFLISLAKDSDAFRILSHIQGFYDAATSEKSVDENDIAVFQLLSFTHYHFLFSAACLMRCHLSEAFASARAAIDGALVAAQIIHDRASQIAYTKREKPFDNFARYLGNLIKDNKPLPHRLVPDLIGLQRAFSGFSVHADVGTFIHRVNVSDPPASDTLAFEYFQFAKNDVERKIHALTVFHTFIMVLDIFSDFLVDEQKAVPKEWQTQLRGLGQAIERQHDELKKVFAEASGG